MILKEIQRKLRNMLLEKKNGEYEYGCVMAQLNIDEAQWEDIQSPIKDGELHQGDNMGREDDPHITILYGLHKSVSDDEIEEVISDFEPFEVELKKVDIFENDDFDVIKFSINNKDLTQYNKILKELPHTNSYPDYKAHVTIAYVKQGMGKEIMDRYKDIEGLSLTCNEIRYSKSDNTNKYYKLNKS
jgi:2'-5' RNA ligase